MLAAPAAAANKPPAKTGRIAVTGGSVCWRRLAQGQKTPLLLLHGGPGVPGDYLERSLAGLSEQVYGTMWGPSEFNVLGNLKDFDCVSQLPSVSCPTLFLCGEFDECTPETTRDYASMVPRSRFLARVDSGGSMSA